MTKEQTCDKYELLWQYVQHSGEKTVVLSFAEIQTVLGFAIDHSFLRYKKNCGTYGYTVGKISLKEQTVSFARNT